MKKRAYEIKFKVMGRYEDGSEDCFEEFNTYEEAEKYLLDMTYVADEFWIQKVWLIK